MWRRVFRAAIVALLAAASCAPPGPAAGVPSATVTGAVGPAAGIQPCAAGGLAQSSLEPAPPASAPVAATPAPSTASPAAAVSATPTSRPAPAIDRVGFPEGYQATFRFLYVYDRLDAKSVSYACGNEIAATARPGQPFPFGSIVVFESWRPKEDAAGNTIKDANGHLIRQSLNAIFVMRKEPGFGEAYQQFRTGEWEYVAYRPDKSFQTPPQLTATCASCHQASNKDRDWTMRAWELPFTTGRYAQAPLPGPTDVSLNRMAFFPNARGVPVGTTVKWTNSLVDKTDHTVSASDGAFSSTALKPGDSFAFTFTKAGTYQYFCSIHPDQMRARIEVK